LITGLTGAFAALSVAVFPSETLVGCVVGVSPVTWVVSLVTGELASFAVAA